MCGCFKNIEILENEKLVQNAQVMGEELIKGFRQLEKELTVLGTGRTLGLLAASGIYKMVETGERFETKKATQVVNEAVKPGLICRSVTYDDVDTIAPLTITKEQLKDIRSEEHTSELQSRGT